jgi:3-oxosteroid 1-dehydrogenase
MLVVGSGGAGLTAALVGRDQHLSTLVVEKNDQFGGTTSYSGGGLWIPNNHISKASGLDDSFEAALMYMENTIEEVGPASSRERKIAFLRHGPEMVRFLESMGLKWMPSLGYPDYYPDKPGGRTHGRSIESRLFNIKRLGSWRDYLLTYPGLPPVPMHTCEAVDMALSLRTLKGLMVAIKVFLLRFIGWRLLGKLPTGLGPALIGHLLLACKQRNMELWRNSPFVELIQKNNEVVGAVVEHEGRTIRVRARRGVLLAAGGFAKNLEMRSQYQEHPVSIEWTSVQPNDMGDAIRAGMKAGAAVALMDDAWWGPSFFNPVEGMPFFMTWERAFPHSIMVDANGERFTNEAQSYIDAGHEQYQQNRKTPAIPAWIIVDARHRRRYPYAKIAPGYTPKWALDSGFIVKAHSVTELAEKTGINEEGLNKTIQRFNEMARRGIDEDFGRGRTEYDLYWGDPRHGPNPTLGTIEKTPFYASKIYPGDLGTKGGLLTDEHARVLREDGSVIKGLYAAGNTSASVMGHTYPGPGSTLGPALTFGFIAAHHMAAEKPV